MFWREIRRRHEESGKFARVGGDSVRALGGVHPRTTTGEDNGERCHRPSRRKHGFGNNSDFAAGVYDGVADVPDSRSEFVASERSRAEGSCFAFAGAAHREFLFRNYHRYEKQRAILTPTDAVFAAQYLFYRAHEMEGTLREDCGGQLRSVFKGSGFSGDLSRKE
jgi:hypothetical protein